MNHLLDESWKDLNQIIIYGFGRLAQGNIDRFIDEFDIKEIIDNKEGSRLERQPYQIFYLGHSLRLG